jgi:hypothetical protein
VLAPAEALRSDVSVPMRQRSSRAPRAAGSAVTTGEPPRGTAVATGSQQEAVAAVAATAAATAASTVPPAPVPAAGGQAAVVEIPDDDAPPPGWGQWENWPALTPEPAAGGAGHAGGRLHGAEAAIAQRRGLVITRASCLPQMSPSRAHSRSGSTPARRRSTSTMPRPCRRCGKSFETTVPRSTMH